MTRRKKTIFEKTNRQKWPKNTTAIHIEMLLPFIVSLSRKMWRWSHVPCTGKLGNRCRTFQILVAPNAVLVYWDYISKMEMLQITIHGLTARNIPSSFQILYSQTQPAAWSMLHHKHAQFWSDKNIQHNII